MNQDNTKEVTRFLSVYMVRKTDEWTIQRRLRCKRIATNKQVEEEERASRSAGGIYKHIAVELERAKNGSLLL